MPKFVGFARVRTHLTFFSLMSFMENSAMAMVAYEDIYLTILSIDGPEWTDKLRMRMYDRNDKEPLPTEQSWLLEKVV